MEAEWDARNRRLRLKVKVAAGEAQGARHRIGVWHLDVVVGRDCSCETHDLASDFSCERLLHVALPLIGFPVLRWQDFEVFENIDVGVLPDLLNNCYFRGV